MKYTISKDEHKALGEDFQKEYKSNNEGGFTLTVVGGEDTGALKRAKDHEKEARKKAEASLAEVKKKLETKEDEIIDIRKGVISKDDADALERSYQEKFTNREAELQAELDKSNASLKKVFVDNVANKLASEVSTVPALMSNEIRQRLTTESVDGKTITRVLDSEGKPTALTVEDLKKEILANQAYAPILIGSKASGSGAAGAGSNGGAKTFGDLTEKERVELYRSNPEEYTRQRDASNSA